MITSHNITHGFNGVCFSSNCPEDLVLCHLVGVQEAMGSRQGEEQRPQIPCVCVECNHYIHIYCVCISYVYSMYYRWMDGWMGWGGMGWDGMGWM